MNRLAMLVACAAFLLGCGPQGGEGDGEVAVDVAQQAVNAPCYGSSCTNQNPQTTGCSNPANGSVWVLQSAGIYYKGQLVGGVELKYSQWCNARWAKTYSYIGTKCVGAQMLYSNGNPVSYQTNTYLCGVSDVYSNMYGGGAGEAKGYLYAGNTTDTYAQAITAPQ